MMDQRLADEIRTLVDAVDDALASHSRGETAPYSPAFLRQVRHELVTMVDDWPSFPFRFGRALVDWPPTDLGGRILGVGQTFERARSKAAKTA